MGRLTIDEARHEVALDSQSVALTRREFSLLATLAGQPGRVCTRAQLLERVWSAEYYDEPMVDVHVANLRNKLGDDTHGASLIETVRGVGYRFSDQTAASTQHG